MRRLLARPVLWVGIVLGVLLVLLAGGYLYARREWNQAQEDLKEYRLDEAQRHLDFCLSIWPHSVEVHLLAARAARLQGDFESAEQHLKRCKELAHGATESIQVEYLLMRVQMGQEDEVAPELMLAVDHGSPESTLIVETLARRYMYNHRYGPAYGVLTRWIQLAPDSAEPYRWRGWVVERLYDWEAAIKDYQKALELDPGLDEVRLRLAEMYLDRSSAPDALPHLERMYREHPDQARVMARLGQCRLLQGENEEARRLMEPAVAQLPDDTPLLIALARLEMREGHPAKAEKYLRHAGQVDPTDAEIQFTLVACLQQQGRYDEATAALEKHRKDSALLKRMVQLIQDEAEHPSTNLDRLYEIGAFFLPANERVGMYWLSRVLQINPAHQPTHKLLADYFESKGNKTQAAAHRSWLRTKDADKKSASGSKP
jgi:tetratricopeptide (TPR) repeat protein